MKDIKEEMVEESRKEESRDRDIEEKIANERKRLAALMHKEMEEERKRLERESDDLTKKKTRNLKPEEKKETSCMIVDNIIYEQVWDGRTSRFVYLNGEGVKFASRVGEWTPIVDDAVTKNFVGLADGVEDYGNAESLVIEVRKHIHKWLDISEDHEILTSYYILFTWVYDRTSTVNYLSPMGDWGSGKTRYLQVIGGICYKPLMFTGSITTAPIFRLIERWKGTLVIDEGDFKKSDEQADIMKIINSGFEKYGANIPRCNPNDVSKIDIFNVFGPKLIGRRKRWNDQATESRCLTEIMIRTTRKDIPPKLPKEFYEEQRVLRRKLLKFRLDNYFKIDDTYIDLGIPNMENRLKQAVSSLTSMFANVPEMLDRFKSYIREYNEKLIEERSGSYEGIIIQSFLMLLRDGEEHIKTSKLVEKIKEEFGEDFSPKYVGKTLKSMGFFNHSKRTKNGVTRVWEWTQKAMQSVTERYLPLDSDLRDFVVTDVTLVTGTYGGLNKNQNNALLGAGGSGHPIASVTSVTSVTKLLENWPQNPELKVSSLMKIGWSEDHIKNALKNGLIFEVRPGWFRKVGGRD